MARSILARMRERRSMAGPGEKYLKPELIGQKPRLNLRAKFITPISTDHRKTNGEGHLWNAARGLSVEAAGIAPAAPIPQVVSPYDTCVEQGCQWSHYVCTDATLRELVANWRHLTPSVR